MYVNYNPSPIGARVGDCAVRAVSKALNTDWDTSYALLAAKGYAMSDMPNANCVIDSVLRNNGFARDVIPNAYPECYTVADFANDHPSGVFVLGIGDHVVAVEDGNIYDSWDSSKEIPIYFWHKKS